MYDRTTVQSATFNMRGQLYRGHANATVLSSSPMVSALGSELDNPGFSPGRGKVLCPWDVQGKKIRAPLLVLVKSIYYQSLLAVFCVLVACGVSSIWSAMASSMQSRWVKWSTF